MNEVLKYFIKSLSSATISLVKKGTLTDKPWALIDNDGEIQKLIFKKDKGLILSKNGKVTEGHWDYYPEAKSLLIDRGTDKLLLNEQFIDENVMILKKDGTENDFFALSNENTIPDYDIPKYLNSLKCIQLGITQRSLLNGNILQIHDFNEKVDVIYARGYKVEQIDNKYNALAIEDGSYMSESRKFTYHVKDGKVTTVKRNVLQKSIDGFSYEIEDGYGYDKKSYLNKRMTINGMPINKERIETDDNTICDLKDSVIIKIHFVETYKLPDGSTIKIEQSERKIRKGDVIIYSEPISPLPDGQYKIQGRLRRINVINSIIQ